VLGAGFTGGGGVLLAGLRHAVEEGFDVINMSLSTTKKPFAAILHELADSAYFRRTVLVASAHNMPVESYPWRFSSVISVGSHEEPDPLTFFYNPSPPVEFFGRGVNVDVAWLEGRSITVSGNSFATPHLSAICALILAKHPELTPFQLKNVLYLTATNVGGGK
jgi:subtilisin